MNITSKKTILNFLGLFIFIFSLNLSVNTLFGQDDEIGLQIDSQTNPLDQIDDQQLEDLFNSDLMNQAFNGEDLFAAYQESMMQMFKQQMKMIEALPEDCRSTVVGTWELWGSLIEKIKDPKEFLMDLCQKTGIKASEALEKDEGDQEGLNLLIEILGKIQDLFATRDFALDLNGASFRDALIENLQNYYEDLSVCIDKVSFIDFSELSILVKSLSYLKGNDIEDFNFFRFELLKDEVGNALLKLNEAQDRLEELENSLGEKDEELKEVVAYWKETLNNFKQVQDEFENGGAASSNQRSSKSKLFSIITKMAPFLENGYFFYSKLLKLYKSDCGFKDLYKVSFFNLLKLDFEKVAKLNITKLGGYQDFLKVLPLCIGKVWGALLLPIQILTQLKNVSGLSGSKNSLLERQLMGKFVWVCLITAYYNTFHRLLLNHKWIENPNFNSSKIYENIYWPGNYKAFKKISWDSLRLGSDYLANLTEIGIESGVSKETLDKVENYSLGLFSPKLVKFLFDTSVPLLVDKTIPKEFINFERERLLKPRPWDWYYVGSRDFKDMSDQTYLRNRILGYISVRFGAMLGKNIAYSGRRPIKSITGRFAKYLAVKMGLIEQDVIDNFPFYKELLINELTFLLKESEKNPSFKVGKKVFLTMLSSLRLVSQLDVVKFEEKVDSGKFKESTIEKFVDKIFTSLADNVVKGVGSGLGAWGSWLFANWAIQKWDDSHNPNKIVLAD